MSRKTEILQSIIDVWCRDQDIDAVLTHLSEVIRNNLPQLFSYKNIT